METKNKRILLICFLQGVSRTFSDVGVSGGEEVANLCAELVEPIDIVVDNLSDGSRVNAGVWAIDEEQLIEQLTREEWTRFVTG